MFSPTTGHSLVLDLESRNLTLCFYKKMLLVSLPYILTVLAFLALFIQANSL